MIYAVNITISANAAYNANSLNVGTKSNREITISELGIIHATQLANDVISGDKPN